MENTGLSVPAARSFASRSRMRSKLEASTAAATRPASGVSPSSARARARWAPGSAFIAS